MTTNDAEAEKRHLEVLTKFVSVQEVKPKYALFMLKSHVLELLPDNRVAICYHHRLPERVNVEVWYSAEKSKAYYCGLMKCGQAWVCPVCAQRIATIRREMLKTALENARSKYVPLLVTYTAQHYKGQPLSTILNGLNAAYRYMRQQRLWRIYKDEYEIRGEIRAVEVTHGESGWHPHLHVIMMLDIGILDYIKTASGDYDIGHMTQAITSHFTSMWIEALEKQKLTAHNGPGLNVRSGWDTLNEYLTKGGSILPKEKKGWGLAEETTLGSMKKAKREGESAWGLLAKSFAGYSYAGELFKEYASATKGKSGLQWSPGLKAELLGDRNEETEVQNDDYEPDEILLAVLSGQDWRAIVSTGGEGILLDNASKGDPREIEKIVREAHKRYALMGIDGKY